VADEFRKMSGDKLDYVFDWQDWLTAHDGGDEIFESEFSVTPSDGEIDIDGPPAQSKTPLTTKVWISGGEVGQTYTVFNTITTVAGRVFTRCMLLRIDEVIL
jgi:hypothetical protein